MVSQYVGMCVAPSTDNYTVGAELLEGTVLDRKVNSPSSFSFRVLNDGGGKVATYALDDKVDFHVGTEPLYQWGSLSALSFDGNGDYVTVSDHASLQFGTGDFSIGFRFKINGVGTNQRIISKRATTGSGLEGYEIYRDPTSSKISFFISDGTNYKTVTTTNTLYDNQWHHVFFVVDFATDVKIYVDGVYDKNVAIDNITDGVDAAGVNLFIGQSTLTEYYFSGILDEVKIYNAALSSTTILADYNGTHSTTNLAAYWDFDEGYGTTATDESTNDNYGTITGASWVNPKIMTGTILDIDLERDQYKRNVMTIRGEDYLTVLAERLARATFPGAVDVSTILVNLLTEFASGEYTTTNVTAAGVTVTNFTVGAQTTLLALMRRLADLPGSSYDFYLDGNNDLVWHPRASATWDSGVTLSGSNIRRMTVNRSTREKKTLIKLTGAQTPVEEAINRQSTVTDSVTLEDNYYADDFIAQHDNLMAVELYLQKVGTPGADLEGRIAIAKYNMPAGDFMAFTLREEDVSTTAGWHRVSTPLNTQVGTRYFVRLDTAGADSSNTYKWYGDAPAVLDTERKAKQSTDGIYWTEYNGDLSMKVYYGEYAEVTASSATTPKREAVVPLPSNSGIDTDTAQEIANQMLTNYLQTAFKATVRCDCPDAELKPSYLITLDESDDGLDSKAYRVERVRMEFGVGRRCDYYDVDVSATLPYTYLSEDYSRLKEALLSGGTGALESGATAEITTAKIGYAKTDKSYVAIYPDEE